MIGVLNYTILETNFQWFLVLESSVSKNRSFGQKVSQNISIRSFGAARHVRQKKGGRKDKKKEKHRTKRFSTLKTVHVTITIHLKSILID